MRLLIADDDTEKTDSLRILLERNKYAVDAVDNGEDAVNCALSGRYDGMISDCRIPEFNGLDIVKKVRDGGCNIPILLMSDSKELNLRVESLDAGADDFLPKPFAYTEFLARVRAMLRRRESFTSEIVTFGDLKLNCSTLELSTDQNNVHLRKKEFQMMQCLIQHPKKLFSTDDLMERIWGWNSEAEIPVVWTNITNLRRKLKLLNSAVGIKTIRGYGYCLVEIEDITT